MALDLKLPPTPPARPGDPAVTAALAVGVRLDDPFPQLYRDDRAADEAIRQVVDALHAGLLTVKDAVEALLLTAGGTGAGGGGDAAGVAQLREDLTALVQRVDGITTTGGGVTPDQLSEAVATRYAKPAGGIPSSDLAAEVRDLLDQIGENAGYVKPTGGIPLDDLDPSIAASLDKADSSVQWVQTQAQADALPLGTVAVVLDDVGDAPYVKPAAGIPAVDLAPGVLAGAGGLRTSAYAQGDTLLPTLTKVTDGPTITMAATGLSSIYWPYLIRVPESVRAANPALGRWRLYVSTDHDAGAGGIAMLYTDAADPGASGTVWTSYRTPAGSAKIFQRGGSDQVETPTVVWNQAQSLFHLYYQIQGGTAAVGGTLQYTALATSPDGVTFTPTSGGFPNPKSDWIGYRHTGYAKVWQVNGKWIGWTLTGGGDQSSYNWWLSNDGRSWVMNRNRILTAASFGGGLRRLGISALLNYRGSLWAMGTTADFVSGAATSATAYPTFFAPLSDDLQSFRGAARFVDFPRILDETSAPPPPPSLAAADDGRLWGAYRVNGAQGSIRFAVIS